MKRFFSSIKDYFIPHRGNKYKPDSLKRESALALLAVILLIELSIMAAPFLRDRGEYLAAVVSSVLTELTNQKRIENNAAALTPNPILAMAAQKRAEDMARRGYFSHKSPEGQMPWHWFSEAGYPYRYAGENLAVNFIDSAEVADAWMRSPTHKSNMVSGNFTEIGIGVATGTYQGRESVFVVQFFGSPAGSKSVPVKKPSAVSAGSSLSAPRGQVLGTTAAMKPSPSLIARFFASPLERGGRMLAEMLSFIAVLLALTIFIKIKVQHLALIRNGLTLMLLIALALWWNNASSRLTVNAPDDTTASAIGATLPIID